MFKAGRSANWPGDVTPSIRVTFSIIAAIALLRCRWIGVSSFAFNDARPSFTEAYPRLATATIEDMTNAFSDLSIAILPAFLMVSYLMAAALLRVRGGAGWLLRTRLLFAGINPNRDRRAAAKRHADVYP